LSDHSNIDPTDLVFAE